MLFMLSALIDDRSDRDFFEDLYYSYENQMFFVANKNLNDNQLSEDALQVAFTKVATNINKLRELDDIQTKHYLLIAAKNAAIDISKNQGNFESIDTDNFYNLSSFNYSDKIKSIEDKSFILSILKKLPQKYIDVLYLHFVIGLRKKEVAKILNISPNTVTQQIKRGKKLFTELYEKEVNK